MKIWRLKSGSVVYDIGANVGLFTRLFSNIGCTVFAFEPHPGAFRELERMFAVSRNVNLFNLAISDEDGHAPLYFHIHGDKEDINFSQGTSLLASKPNVDESNATICKIASISRIIEMVDHVDFMKIDVEGAEIKIINHLLNQHETLQKISFIGCETHDNKWSHLVSDTQDMKRKIADANLIKKFDFTWR